MAERSLLVDARPIHHPTAGGRGVGNYTLGLLQGLGHAGATVTALVERTEHVAELKGALPSTRIELMGRGVVRNLAQSGTWYVATGMFLHPVTADPIPAAVTAARLPVAAVMYDVIPQRYPQRYLGGRLAERLTTVRGLLARTADLTLAISRFSADTAIEVLGLAPARVRVIGAGVEARFVPPLHRVASTDVVAVTGPDPRKNTEGLLRAWARIDADLRARYRLVVVSSGPADLLERWRSRAAELRIAPSVTFAGAVGASEMVSLLQRAHLVVQPSSDEGFGLPVAEAAACDSIVICSRTSALPEVLAEPAATFSPHDPDDVALAIERALTDPEHREVLRAAARRAARHWRWDRVAGTLLDAVGEVEPVQPVASPRKRIALITPPADLPASAHLGAAFAAALTRATGVEVTLFVDSAGRPDRATRHAGEHWPAAAFGRVVPFHDFDDVVTVIDAVRPLSVAARIADRFPTSVWVVGQTELHDRGRRQLELAPPRGRSEVEPVARAVAAWLAGAT